MHVNVRFTNEEGSIPGVLHMKFLATSTRLSPS